MNKITKIIILASFLILPIILFVLPTWNEISIGFVEFFTELIILIELFIFYLRKTKGNKLDKANWFLFISLTCVYLADTIYNARLMRFIPDEYDIYGDLLYSAFAFFLNLFLIKKLNIYQRNLSEWIWIFLATFILDLFIAYRFNLIPYAMKHANSLETTSFISMIIPYFFTNHTLLWKVNSTIYLLLTIISFSLILPFIFRVTTRRNFWFLNFLLLLLIADIEIRYQDNFVNTFSFAWAELAWCSSFIGIAWLVFLSRKELDLIHPILLSPFVSIRSLLTLAICTANILFLFSILAVERYSLNNAIDVGRTFFSLFIFWVIANEFSMWLAQDLIKIINGMFTSKKNINADGVINFQIKSVMPKNPIFEISQMISSYNGLVEQTNKQTT